MSLGTELGHCGGRDSPPAAARTEAGTLRTILAAQRVLASPAVRARARDFGIDLSEVRPAEDGRIRHVDLDQFLAYNAGGGCLAAGPARGGVASTAPTSRTADPTAS
jgi:pyruvate/2-oxoglutarate dehydrogenase complex dihydrolipoamide acyltransferase (E2) component